MYNAEVRIFTGFCVVFVLTACAAFCQNIRPHEIESLIDEWNFANNTRNIHSFEKVYADRLTYNSKEISKSEIVELKRRLFNDNTSFRQRIITEIKYIPGSNGQVRCEFMREVNYGNGWKRLSSYLTVAPVGGNKYAIVGEGDVTRPRSDERTPPPAVREEEIEQSPPALVDTSSAFPHVATGDSDSMGFESEVFSAERHDVLLTDQVGEYLTLSNVDKLFTDIESFGVVAVPKGYLYILIGILGVGALMIFVADSVTSGKRRRVRDNGSHAEAEHVVRDFKIQAAFEAFVVTLFDPLYFKAFRPKSEHVYAGRVMDAEKGPDLVLNFEQKDVSVRFAITCQYYQHAAKNEVQLLPIERQDVLRQIAADREMEIYYVLGFGGKPDDPLELFFIPASEVRTEYMTRSQLKQYSKSGMFYYNRRTGRIQ